MSIAVIVNPAAGRGRGAKSLPAIRAAFAAHGVTDIRTSASRENERTLAMHALADGCTTIVACGGDGTWSNVANAILEQQRGTSCRLGLIAAGTGNDFAKTVGAPSTDFARSAALAVKGGDQLVDVGKVEDHFFLNIAGFGFDIAVLEDIGNIPLLRGNAVYVVSALRQIFGYKGVDIDIAGRGFKRHLMLVIANAKNFGGAFRIAPNASLTDGKLDAVSIHNASALGRLRLFGAAGKGTHVGHQEVVVDTASSFTLRFRETPAYETDGEYRRASSPELTVQCIPKALRVVV